jgi:hypothetical protein
VRAQRLLIVHAAAPRACADSAPVASHSGARFAACRLKMLL